MYFKFSGFVLNTSIVLFTGTNVQKDGWQSSTTEQQKLRTLTATWNVNIYCIYSSMFDKT